MAKDTKSSKDKKNNKHFFKDFKTELKKVIWPTPKQLLSKTLAVIVIVLITAAIVFVLDVVFNFFNEKGVNRLKSNIRNKVVVENTVEGEQNESTADEDTTKLEEVEQTESEQENAE